MGFQLIRYIPWGGDLKVGEMLPKNNTLANVERFSGFADLYDRYRPQPPKIVTEIILKYLGKRPSVVVDLGCGTGLSTYIWEDLADKVIGIEPNQDMREKAREKGEKIIFKPGYSNSTQLDSDSVDVVTCSQSFHWMEPESALKEVGRILKEGGIFAVYDCDWPPTVDWLVEDAYMRFSANVKHTLEAVEKEQVPVKRWEKDKHLENLKRSNRFRFTKEIVFHSEEKGDAEGFIGLALSQGSVQTLLKLGNGDIQNHIDRFANVVNGRIGKGEVDLIFSYRMRLGIK
jgi:ubiquinone/menaquinone biosynthesis C-methylase UbiE